MTNHQQQNPDSNNIIATEKKAWVAPALIEETVSETKSGSYDVKFENGWYHS